MLAPPIRCFTCGKVFTNRNWKEYMEEPYLFFVMNPSIKRECCRRMFISNTEKESALLLKYKTVGSNR